MNKIRDEAIIVKVAVPGQRWEVEFSSDGMIEVERFNSDQHFYDERELEELFKQFSAG